MKNLHKKRNWNQYNQNLINRGSINFWFSKETVKKWKAKKDKKHFGRPFFYSNVVILTAHTLRFVYHLPLRALQGFMKSLIDLLGISLKTPNYSQICRRIKNLNLPNIKIKKRITDIVVDASGLKVYGEGEWKVKVHGKSKRRKWMKIHIGIDPKSQEILISKLTENNGSDIDTAIEFIQGMPPYGNFHGDGLYDAERIYEALWKKKRKPFIPVRKNTLHKRFLRPWLKPKENQINIIKGLGGDGIARSLWKKLTGYHKRSLVETAFYRFKQLLGSGLKSRKSENQVIEAKLKCHILNKMLLVS